MGDVQEPDFREKNSAFELLVAQYQTELLRYCYVYLKDAEQAKDAVQETFLKAYRGWEQRKTDKSERAWLMKIALNVCHDARKSGWFRHVDKHVTPEDLPAASVPFTAAEDQLIVQVMALPPRLREAITLYYYQGLNVQEIADALGITHSAVSDRLSRAREKLRGILEGRDET